MSLFSFRGKPGWESRDAAERAAAVTAADDPALIARLSDFARADESAGVRRAAVRRLTDLPLLGDRARNDLDPGVREVANERYRQLLAGSSGAPLPLAERSRVLRTEDSHEVLAWVAVHAPEPELRRMALERHARPNFLLDRCQRDPDPALRSWLLEQVVDLAALERIAENSRKSDKRLAHAARERAEALRLAAGDTQALKRRALAIADDLDQLRRERPADLTQRAASLHAEWSALASQVDAAMVQRVQGYIDALAAAIAQPSEAPPVVPEPEIVFEATGAPVAAIAQDSVAASVLLPLEPRGPDPELLAQALEAESHVGDIAPDALAALGRRHASAWDRQRDHLAAEIDAHARFEAALEGARARHARESEARQASVAQATALVEQLEAAVQAQQAQDARDRHATLLAMREARTLPPALNRRIGAIAEAYDKLVRWQHWSNNKVRASLCEQIEALSSAGAHPDALANRVREAQLEWQRLDASERLDAAASAKIGLSRRFRAVCHRAMAPARGYFEKRDELRGQRRAAIDAVLARAEGELPFDPQALQPLRRELADAMRRLDELDPRTRAGLGKRLRAALERLDAARDSRNSAFETEKRKIVANLRRQLAQADGADAIALARDAQSRIAALPRAGREAEESIRVELSALIDPLFEKDREQREGEQSAARERELAQAAVLSELAALASGDVEGLRHADARLTALSQRWRELSPPAAPMPATARDSREHRDARDPRGARGRTDSREQRDTRGRPPRDDRGRDLERRFDAALERVRVAQKQAQERLRSQESVGWLKTCELCAAFEAQWLSGAGGSASSEALRNALQPKTPAHPGLRARIERALGWLDTPIDAVALAAANAAALRTAAELALSADAIRGVDSPPESSELRRAWQIKRLAERMSGGVAPDAARERQQLLDAWLVCAPLTDEERRAFAARIEPVFVIAP